MRLNKVDGVLRFLEGGAGDSGGVDDGGDVVDSLEECVMSQKAGITEKQHPGGTKKGMICVFPRFSSISGLFTSCTSG